jgi:hypothetical protein
MESIHFEFTNSSSFWKIGKITKLGRPTHQRLFTHHGIHTVHSAFRQRPSPLVLAAICHHPPIFIAGKGSVAERTTPFALRHFLASPSLPTPHELTRRTTILHRHLPPHELTIDSRSLSSSTTTQSITNFPFILYCSPTQSPTLAIFHPHRR